MEQCGSAPLACPAVRIVARANRPCPIAMRTVAPPPAAAPRGRAHHSCGLAVGRDVPIAPPRLGAVRGLASRSRTPLPLPSHNSCPAKFARALPDAARCLAAGPPGSRPTAITHRKIRTRWLT